MNNQDPKENYGADPLRAPDLREGDTPVFKECGRLLPRGGRTNKDGTHEMVCYRAYYFILVKQQYGGYALLVKHGGGQEALPLGYNDNTVAALARLTSDDRYAVLWQLYETARDATRREEGRLLQAFAEKRLKKSVRRGQVKVYVVPSSK